ncbi:hypothetical protein Elgi_38370 [Paenibacillus elgii]|uniref:hypothetical protein n=1 Tax=Paenibacillus elgii TaxID=189691 RepID=UPI002D7D2B7B|nr:hypothetical protein Elgi_38370 [Paenibacillus elgii]
MKISKSVVDRFQDNCPLSSYKCDSFSEIEYKIKRAVSLGKVLVLHNDGSRTLGYYHLRFVVRNNKVMDMFKTEDDKIINVSEKEKYEYDIENNKLMV